MTLRWIAALLLVSAGCSSALLTPAGKPDPETEEIKSRIIDLQRQARMSEVELERLRRQVADMEARLGDESEPVPEEKPVPVLHDELPGDDLTAQEPIEESDIAPPGPPTPILATPAEAVETGPLSEEAQELYDRGYTFYHRSQYVDAETAFQRFLASYPNTELADNAHYWIGESRFARADYRGALAAFRETLDRYPDGNKLPDALLKTGDCMSRLGDVDGARRAYAAVVSRFPNSAAALSAEERQAELP